MFLEQFISYITDFIQNGTKKLTNLCIHIVISLKGILIQIQDWKFLLYRNCLFQS